MSEHDTSDIPSLPTLYRKHIRPAVYEARNPGMRKAVDALINHHSLKPGHYTPLSAAPPEATLDQPPLFDMELQDMISDHGLDKKIAVDEHTFSAKPRSGWRKIFAPKDPDKRPTLGYVLGDM